MSRKIVLLGRWLVAGGFLIPASILALFVALSYLSAPDKKEGIAYMGGFLFLASLVPSLAFFIVGSGLGIARVVRVREEVTKIDYLFLALGVNGALFLLIMAAVIFYRT